MNLPPWWKVRREIYRLRDQILRKIALQVDPFRQARHDRQFDQLVTLMSGSLPRQGKVAVLVVFQPKGIAASLDLTLRHLTLNGYSTVVVLNGPHPQSDVDRIAGLSAAVVGRPNTGYDFGAYRDGIKLLGDRLGNLDRLILMNDSTWFPLRMEDDSLLRMEALGEGLAGHIFKTEVRGRPERDHVEAHLLMFSRSLLLSQPFQEFWDAYLMSDLRATTVERGEKAVFNAMRNAGVPINALLSREAMLAIYDAGDASTQLFFAQSLVHHRKDAKEFCEAVLGTWEKSPTAPAQFRNWIDESLANSLQHLISTTFIDPAMRLGGMGFVKKARDYRFHLARKRVLDLDEARAIAPLHADVRAEMMQMVETWVPSFDRHRRPDAPD